MSMQDVVQLAVLRAVDRNAAIDAVAVAARCPRADVRDVARAVQLLAGQRAIEAPPPASRRHGRRVPARLTEAGRRRLAAAHRAAAGNPNRA